MKPITTYLANSFPEHSVTMSARPGGSLVVCLERAGNRYLRVVAAGALTDADQLDALVKQIQLDLKLRKGGSSGWLRMATGPALSCPPTAACRCALARNRSWQGLSEGATG
ncbi:hypothetical protein PSm6_55540 [Pseudomonas solani]|uniref:DUF3509 domain-containing protein n=1 Tax=Pseudomonas solani TaxID=2731552 RepID=A0ABM7LHR3_9PSED|nr:hypothetical protein PSm6_55540 [Pseudomonas solani]